MTRQKFRSAQAKATKNNCPIHIIFMTQNKRRKQFCLKFQEQRLNRKPTCKYSYTSTCCVRLGTLSVILESASPSFPDLWNKNNTYLFVNQYFGPDLSLGLLRLLLLSPGELSGGLTVSSPLWKSFRYGEKWLCFANAEFQEKQLFKKAYLFFNRILLLFFMMVGICLALDLLRRNKVTFRHSSFRWHLG